MKNLFSFFGVIFGLLIVYTIILNSHEARRIYHLYFLFDEKNISANFRNMSKFFATKEITATENMPELEGNRDFELPTTFPFNNFEVSSDYFLRYTQTDALLVLHKDQLIFEQYYGEFKPEDLHISWSISKSIVSLLLGIAIDEGKITSLQDPVTKYLPELSNSGYKNVTVEELAQMTSGIKFNEDYADFFSDINIFSYRMAFGLPLNDFAEGLKDNPTHGQHQYVSIDTHVLGMLIARATGQELNQYLSDKLWSKMGMESNALWMSDGNGTEFYAGGINARAVDLARFGLLVLNKGNDLVPEQWIEELGLANSVSRADYEDYAYTRQWWVPQDTEQRELLAIGVYDQYIYINRDTGVVVVKLSSNPNYLLDDYISESQSLSLFRAISERIEPSAKK